MKNKILTKMLRDIPMPQENEEKQSELEVSKN